MFDITDNVIHLTRGDYASIKCAMTGKDDVPYTMQEGDFLTLTVREIPSDSSPILMQITSLNDTIAIQHEDTMDLMPGIYSADIQLTMSDGKRFTFWPTLEDKSDKGRSKESSFKNFVIMPEVTRV